MIGTQAWSNEVSTLQKQLRILGYDPGAIDGLWGGLTQNALQKFLLQQGQSFDGVLDRNEFQLLETELKKQGIEIRASGNWNYRATSISFGGYDRADQPVYDAIKTIKNIPDFGFNVLTIDFRCTGKIDTSAPKHYPLSRHTGCSIAKKKSHPKKVLYPIDATLQILPLMKRKLNLKRLYHFYENLNVTL